jgi:hypothetical protein
MKLRKTTGFLHGKINALHDPHVIGRGQKLGRTAIRQKRLEPFDQLGDINEFGTLMRSSTSLRGSLGGPAGINEANRT